MPATNGSYDLVCFDNDGTLFMSHLTALPGVQRGFEIFCKDKGYDLPTPAMETIKALTGHTPEKFYPMLLPEALKPLAPELREYCLREEIKEVRAGGQLFPGAVGALVALRAAGHSLAVVTNGSERYTQAIAARCHFDRYFDFIYFRGYNGWRTKYDLLGGAIEKFGARAPVMIGDRGEDIESGKQRHAFTIAALWGYGTREELAPADATAAAITEIPGLLDPA